MTALADWSAPLGFIAATLTTAAFVPQALLTLRTRNVTGLSVPMYTLFTLGVALWLVYGMLLAAWPIIVANAITLILSLTILIIALQGRRGARRGGR